MPISKARAKRIADSVEEIGKEATAELFGVSLESVNRYVRRAKGEKAIEFFSKKDTAKPILVIPDTHIPYQHEDMIPFLLWVQKTYKCRQRVIHVGDLIDCHSMSFHTSEPDALSPEEEYSRAKEVVAEFAEAFPYGDLVLGNHDRIGARKMIEARLPPSMLKESNDLFNLPKGWTVHELYYVIQEWDVLVEHGIGSAGKYGCANTAKEKRCSYVQGHTHSNAAVIYSSNYNSTIFGMNVGWLGDEGSLAVRYAKYATRKGVLGCGVVYSGEHAEFVPMSAYYKENR
jgi:predicted phosphodiesterase